MRSRQRQQIKISQMLGGRQYRKAGGIAQGEMIRPELMAWKGAHPGQQLPDDHWIAKATGVTGGAENPEKSIFRQRTGCPAPARLRVEPLLNPPVIPMGGGSAIAIRKLASSKYITGFSCLPPPTFHRSFRWSLPGLHVFSKRGIHAHSPQRPPHPPANH